MNDSEVNNIKNISIPEDVQKKILEECKKYKLETCYNDDDIMYIEKYFFTDLIDAKKIIIYLLGTLNNDTIMLNDNLDLFCDDTDIIDFSIGSLLKYNQHDRNNYLCLNCYNCEDCTRCNRCHLIRNCSNCSLCNSCQDCEECSNCHTCTQCTVCNNSSFCYDCIHCKNCAKCDKCTRCSACNNCSCCNKCINCEGCCKSKECNSCGVRNGIKMCMNCRKCVNCKTDCKNCIECTNCNNCTNCIDCINCTDCKSCDHMIDEVGVDKLNEETSEKSSEELIKWLYNLNASLCK